MSDFPGAVHVMEVGPRDGLQIESRVLKTQDKVRLINAIAEAGVSEIEAGSFVNPKAVPQMADSGDVFAALEPRKNVTYRALWLNPKGFERASATANVTLEGRILLTASDAFSKRNTNRSIKETFEEVSGWIERYKASGLEPDCAAVMAAFGCNFEGDVPVSRVVSMVGRLAEILHQHGSALRHLSLADTMGWANPAHVKRLVGALREKWPELRIKLHLHDTRGLAMANALAGLQMGVAEFDGSVGGLGGCPFAGNKGAAGNICTEDLVFMCEEIGIPTGINLTVLIEAARLAEHLVGHEVPGKLVKGGLLTRQ